MSADREASIREALRRSETFRARSAYEAFMALESLLGELAAAREENAALRVTNDNAWGVVETHRKQNAKLRDVQRTRAAAHEKERATWAKREEKLREALRELWKALVAARRALSEGEG